MPALKIRDRLVSLRNTARELRIFFLEVVEAEREIRKILDLLTARKMEEVTTFIEKNPEKAWYLGHLLFNPKVSIYAAQVIMNLVTKGVDIPTALPYILKAYFDSTLSPDVKRYIGAALRGEEYRDTFMSNLDITQNSSLIS